MSSFALLWAIKIYAQFAFMVFGVIELLMHQDDHPYSIKLKLMVILVSFKSAEDSGMLPSMCQVCSSSKLKGLDCLMGCQMLLVSLKTGTGGS